MENRAQLLEAAREITDSPGVYLMKDAGGGVLYVGKAKNLRNRVTTYFQPARHEVGRIEMLVGQVQEFELILTETETEALILECTLIKKYKPKFNVRLKDDKAYPYIKIQLNDTAPRLEWTRRVQRDGARYFGPFPSAWAARQAMELLNETFKLRDCSDNTFRHRSRPCILYQIGRCTAPCVGLVSDAVYRESVLEAVAVLEGKSDRLVTSLERGMTDAASHMEYEKAAEYRDQIENLKLLTETQGVLEAGRERNRDVLDIARREGACHGVVLIIRSGKLVAVRHFNLQNVDPSLTDAEVLFELASQFYVAREKQPKEAQFVAAGELLFPTAPDEPDLLERLAGATVKVPESDEDRQLINVARANAQHALETWARKSATHGLLALEDVWKRLHLTKPPQRIECYDISNIQGQDAVGSRVVFVSGEPDKNLYRRYKIRTVEGANDFAMLKEVLGRRFAKAEDPFPDLVVIDGGKGQLSQAVAIMDELDVQGVDVVGLAKARVERDFEASEVRSTSERVFIPNRKNPIPLFPHMAAYKLMTHVRDEAHRFAISYHRQLRQKRSMGQ